MMSLYCAKMNFGDVEIARCIGDSPEGICFKEMTMISRALKMNEIAQVCFLCTKEVHLTLA